MSGLLLLPVVCGAQGSQHALRFFGTGVGPPGFQDRALIPLDDNTNGPNASAPADLGNGSFTMEWWMRGRLADNASSNSGGDQTFSDNRWIEGHIILDRDIWCGSERKFGVSIAGGYVRFGLSPGDPPGADAGNRTIEGNVQTLNDAWRHVAVVRDAAAGAIRIYVDGALDYQSADGLSYADLSYPDAGIPVTGDCGTGQLTPYGWYLVVAAEKHDAGAAYPSFNGYVDELRLWNTARTAGQISSNRYLVIPTNTAGLVGYYRFEEGSGTNLADSSAAGSYAAQLRAGVAGNGQWVSRAADTNNTAPVQLAGNQAPSASISAAPLIGPPPLAVEFNGAGSSDPDGGPEPLVFAWTFGDGGASSLTNPAHAYVSSGIYTSWLRVSDGVLTGAASRVIRVGPTSRLDFASVPSGLPLAVDGATNATPFSLAVLTGAVVFVEAPSHAVPGGTAHVFRCWSDGGARAHAVTAPPGGLLLRAGYAPAPGGDLAVPVPATNRNAESYAGATAFANAYDAGGLCCGRDGGGRYETALAFPESVSQGATIQSAAVQIRATSDQSGAPMLAIRAFSVSNVAAFAAGAGPSVTGLYALTAASVSWTPASFAPGQTYTSPSLSAIVQEVVNRADWSAGHFLGVVFVATNGAGDHWRCWNNFQSGNPPVLQVAYSSGAAGDDLDGDGMPDGWEGENGLDCTSGSDAGLDGDEDRLPNADEYMAGTDPRDSQSVFRVTAETRTPNAAVLWWSAVTGRAYTVETSPSLTPAAWSNLSGSLPGATGKMGWTNPPADSDPTRYFRLGVERP